MSCMRYILSLYKAQHFYIFVCSFIRSVPDLGYFSHVHSLAFSRRITFAVQALLMRRVLLARESITGDPSLF